MARSTLRLVNITRDVLLAERGRRADTFWSRGKGLMFERELPDDACLIIDPCGSIHMFGMRFALDVLYVDREHHVVRVQQGIKPWRVGPLHTRGARYVVELPAGAIARSGTAVGDRLRIEPATA